MPRISADSTTRSPTKMMHAEPRCSQCGYDVRGLSPDDVCPECGFTISDEPGARLLRYADPNWLRRIRRGAALKQWSVLTTLLIVLPASLMTTSMVPSPILTVPVAISLGLWLWSAYLITLPEPGQVARGDPARLRMTIRASAVLASLGTAFTYIGLITSPKDGVWLLGEGSLVLLQVAAVLTVAGVLECWGELVYFRRLARRVPAPRLARLTTLFVWGLPAALILQIIGPLVLFVVGGSRAAGALPQLLWGVADLATLISPAAGWVVVAMTIGLLFVLEAYRTVFTVAILAARSVNEPIAMTQAALSEPMPPAQDVAP